MRIGCIRTVCFLLISFVALNTTRLVAQSRVTTNSPSGVGPAFEASAGYLFMTTTSSGVPRVNLSGVDANGVMLFTPRWGAMLDFSFARAPNVPPTGHSYTFLSGLLGPEFFLVDNARTNIFVHGLAGASFIDSAVLATPTDQLSGYTVRFSYAAGGGVEFTLGGPLAVRFTGDYQRTTFVNSALAQKPQDNIRGVVSLVFRLGSRY